MPEVARRLIEAGADVNAKTSSIPRASSSRMGARVSHLTTQSRLMRSFPAHRVLTPLHIAAAKSQSEIVKALIAKGAQVNVRDQAGRSPLCDALHDAELTRLLLKEGADPDHQLVGANGSAVVLALEKNQLDSLMALINAGASLEPSEKRSPLQTAIDRDYSEAVELLLKSGADPKSRFENRPMIDYACHKSAETLEALLKAGAAPNAGSENLLIRALESDLIENFRLLLKHGAAPDGKNANARPVFSATPYSRHIPPSIAFLDALIEHGANLNVQDDNGMTPLARATTARDKDYVLRLLKAGADPNLADKAGHTPLHHAASLKSGEIMKLLLSHKADPNRFNNRGDSPLDLLKPGQPDRFAIPHPGATQPRPARSTFSTAASTPGHAHGAHETSSTKPGSESELAELLRSHGAVDDLSRGRHISAAREATGIRVRVFDKSLHPANRHTLTEFIHRALTPDDADTSSIHRNPFAFPDLTQVTIRRREGEKESSTTVNFLDHLRSDTSAPIRLQWGDIVEISERPHPVCDRWRGADKLVWQRLHEKLHRRVKIRVGGATQEFALLPFRLPDSRGNETPETAGLASLHDSLGVYRHSVSEPSSRTMQRILAAFQERLAKSGKDSETVSKASLAPYLRGFWLRQTLKDSRRLLSTSDTSSIKIHRKTQDGKTTTLDFNLDDTKSGDIWLQDGDVIEIPDRK